MDFEQNNLQNDLDDPFPPVPVSPFGSKYSYEVLGKLPQAEQINVYGVIKSFDLEKNKSTDDWELKLHLMDKSLRDSTPILCRLWSRNLNVFSLITSPGDIIRIHRVRCRKMSYGQPELSAHIGKKGCHFVVWKGEPGSSMTPMGGSARVNSQNYDTLMVKVLREWWQKYRRALSATESVFPSSEPGGAASAVSPPKTTVSENLRSDPQRIDKSGYRRLSLHESRNDSIPPAAANCTQSTLDQSDVDYGCISIISSDQKKESHQINCVNSFRPNAYRNLLVEVVGVMKTNTEDANSFVNSVFLRVWDGTRIGYPIGRIDVATEISSDQAKANTKLDSSLDNLLPTYTVDIQVWDEHAKVAVNFEPGDIVLLVNVHSYKPRNCSEATDWLTVHGKTVFGRKVLKIHAEYPNCKRFRSYLDGIRSDLGKLRKVPQSPAPNLVGQNYKAQSSPGSRITLNMRTGEDQMEVDANVSSLSKSLRDAETDQPGLSSVTTPKNGTRNKDEAKQADPDRSLAVTSGNKTSLQVTLRNSPEVRKALQLASSEKPKIGGVPRAVVGMELELSVNGAEKPEKSPAKKSVSKSAGKCKTDEAENQGAAVNNSEKIVTSVADGRERGFRLRKKLRFGKRRFISETNRILTVKDPEEEECAKRSKMDTVNKQNGQDLEEERLRKECVSGHRKLTVKLDRLPDEPASASVSNESVNGNSLAKLPSSSDGEDYEEENERFSLSELEKQWANLQAGKKVEISEPIGLLHVKDEAIFPVEKMFFRSVLMRCDKCNFEKHLTKSEFGQLGKLQTISDHRKCCTYCTEEMMVPVFRLDMFFDWPSKPEDALTVLLRGTIARSLLVNAKSKKTSTQKFMEIMLKGGPDARALWEKIENMKEKKWSISGRIVDWKLEYSGSQIIHDKVLLATDIIEE